MADTGSAGERPDLSERQGDNPGSPQARRKSSGSRIAQDSLFYTRVLPALILGMGLLTVGLILFAAGILLGIIPFR